jgi:signal transduction histidine kinase
MKIFARIRGFVYKISLNGLQDRSDIELFRKIRLLNLSAITAIVILIFMSLTALWEREFVLGIIDMSAGLFLIATLIFLGRSGNFRVASAIGVYFMEVFLLFFLLTGGSGTTGHLWAYTLPLFATFLLGSRRGLIASIIFVGIIAAFFLINPQYPYLSTYSVSFKIRFFLSFFVVTVFSYHFENLRILTYRQLERRNVELKAETRRAEEASRTKSDFLANMSHELRTPLNHIIGFGGLIRDQQAGELNERQAEYMDDILNSSNHLLSLINDVLDLAKVEAGKLKLNLISRRGIELIDDVLKMFQNRAASESIDLVKKILENDSEIAVDPTRFTQIMYNLLSNALKFTPQGGTVALTLKKVDHDLVFCVEDTGIGIEKEHLLRVFESFEQVESNVNRRFKGTGLGLALTRRMVELHGGKIWAASEGLGKGAQFCFTLPIVKPGQ